MNLYVFTIELNKFDDNTYVNVIHECSKMYNSFYFTNEHIKCLYLHLVVTLVFSF